MTKETTQIEAAIESSTNTITYLVSVLGEELVSAAQKLGEMQDLDSALYNNSTAIKALQSAQTCREPAPRNEHIEGLEEAINKSGGPKLGDPEYIFTDMRVVATLRKAAKAYAANMEDKS